MKLICCFCLKHNYIKKITKKTMQSLFWKIVLIESKPLTWQNKHERKLLAKIFHQENYLEILIVNYCNVDFSFFILFCLTVSGGGGERGRNMFCFCFSKYWNLFISGYLNIWHEEFLLGMEASLGKRLMRKRWPGRSGSAVPR